MNSLLWWKSSQLRDWFNCFTREWILPFNIGQITTGGTCLVIIFWPTTRFLSFSMSLSLSLCLYLYLSSILSFFLYLSLSLSSTVQGLLPQLRNDHPVCTSWHWTIRKAVCHWVFIIMTTNSSISNTMILLVNSKCHQWKKWHFVIRSSLVWLPNSSIFITMIFVVNNQCHQCNRTISIIISVSLNHIIHTYFHATQNH